MDESRHLVREVRGRHRDFPTNRSEPPDVCDMTHSYVCHDSFARAPWLIYSRLCRHFWCSHELWYFSTDVWEPFGEGVWEMKCVSEREEGRERQGCGRESVCVDVLCVCERIQIIHTFIYIYTHAHTRTHMHRHRHRHRHRHIDPQTYAYITQTYIYIYIYIPMPAHTNTYKHIHRHTGINIDTIETIQCIHPLHQTSPKKHKHTMQKIGISSTENSSRLSRSSWYQVLCLFKKKCIYIDICICIHIYICIYTCMNIYIYLHILYTNISVYIHMYVCIYTYVCIFIHQKNLAGNAKDLHISDGICE